MHEQVYLGDHRQAGQHIEIGLRQRGDPEQAQARGQALGLDPAPLQVLHKTLVQAGTMWLALALGEQAPEAGLPMFGLPRLPGQQPVGAIDQVLVKDIGDALRQLVGLEAALVTV